MIGITSYGAYIPRLRLNRMSIVQSMGWFLPGLMTVAQGERSMCYHDEDAITMAFEAARNCLTGKDKQEIDAVYLASTTLPYVERQNAGIISTALNLKDNLVTSDFTSAQKASTTALISALDAVKGGDKKVVLVTSGDKRKTKVASFYEMWYGDGAAAVTVGDEDVIAEYKGSYSVAYDFVSQYRGAGKETDYQWEERWIRDEGYTKIIPEAVNGLMSKLGISMDDVDKVVFPCFIKSAHKGTAKILGIAPEKLVDSLQDVCGETGTAHPLLMLASVLDDAQPGEKIIVAGYGQGCDALLFEVTENITKLADRDRFKNTLEYKETTDNYMKFLAFRGIIEPEFGIRNEANTKVAMTALWRNRKTVLGLVGGKCTECDYPQYPKTDMCVNPNCNATRTQEEYEFAEVPAKVLSFTGDMLAISIDPPHKYGMIGYEGGGRHFIEITDCNLDDVQVGLSVKMVFRMKLDDKGRGYTGYTWKAIPAPGAIEEMSKTRFDGRVAIITGAGGGLGKAYALLLGQLGAKVVVNDLGGARDGSGGGGKGPADLVVDEIKASGGEAVANYDNVATPEGGENIVKTALDAFGRVDILIKNAGILRDKSFVKMEPENWQSVLDVHLNGAYNVTKPAFVAMRENKFGRIIMTTSGAGLYGNFGQTNYSSAKLGLAGFMNSLKIEGAKYNINVNTIAPLAASRLTEDIMPPDLLDKLKPEFVSPMALYLCSEESTETGQIYNVGMGYFSKAALMQGPGMLLGDADNPATLEDIHSNWEKINSIEGAKEMGDVNAGMFALLTPPAEPSGEADAEAGGDISVQDIMSGMIDGFNPDAAAGVDEVFQYEISGSGGGEWHYIVKDGKCSMETGVHDKPSCTLKVADADFIAMNTGALSAMDAFSSGKLQMEGDIMKSQLIEKLFTT
ncbi:MAG: SDR family NAD(P)-dependent oxidoreductase [Desulfobacterales bacterium]|nr:SDR family NAD(P)-dependent oxidoreductase [Desulfobacterales bacterium]